MSHILFPAALLRWLRRREVVRKETLPQPKLVLEARGKVEAERAETRAQVAAGGRGERQVPVVELGAPRVEPLVGGQADTVRREPELGNLRGKKEFQGEISEEWALTYGRNRSSERKTKKNQKEEWRSTRRMGSTRNALQV